MDYEQMLGGKRSKKTRRSGTRKSSPRRYRKSPRTGRVMRLSPQALQGLGFKTAYDTAQVPETQTAPAPPTMPPPPPPPQPTFYNQLTGTTPTAPPPPPAGFALNEAAAFAAETAAAATAAAVEIPIAATTAAFGAPGGLYPPVPEPTAPVAAAVEAAVGAAATAATLPVAAAVGLVNAEAGIPGVATAGPNWTPEGLDKQRQLVSTTRDARKPNYNRDIPGVTGVNKLGPTVVPRRLLNLLNIAQGQNSEYGDVVTTPEQAAADVRAFIATRNMDNTVEQRRADFQNLYRDLANQNRLGGGQEPAPPALKGGQEPAPPAQESHPLVSLIGGFFRK